MQKSFQKEILSSILKILETPSRRPVLITSLGPFPRESIEDEEVLAATYRCDAVAQANCSDALVHILTSVQSVTSNLLIGNMI